MPDTYLSFDIGSRNVHLVEGQVKGNFVKIFKNTNVELPKGTIIDGLITNSEALALAMQEAISRMGSSTKEAIITINANSIIIREFEIPAGSPKELEGMINNEIRQYFGISDTDLVEYRKIAEVESNGVKKVKVRAAVMNQEIALEYYNMLNSLGLTPVALDIHPNAISKLCQEDITINGLDFAGENFILLDIGYMGTMIYVIAQGTLDFFRSVNFGGKTIDSLLASVLGLSEEEAARQKLVVLGEAASQEENKALSAIRPLYGELLEELRKVIQFFLSRSGSKKLDKIYLSGGGSSLSGLAPYLAQGLGFEVQKLYSLSTVQPIDGQTTDMSSFVNAAGALIRL